MPVFKKAFRDRGLPGTLRFDEIDYDYNQFFYSLFAEPEKTNVAPHIDIPSKVFCDTGEQSVLIIRKAYREILPYVEEQWGTGFAMVTGTPGVGKTYLGVWHLRLMVLSGLEPNSEGASSDCKKGSVFAYFQSGSLYVFTWDEQQKKDLNLQHKTITTDEGGGERTLWSGVISNLEAAVGAAHKLLGYPNCYVIADPQDQDPSIANRLPDGGNLVVYASHGHPIIRQLKTKKPILSDNNTFVLPGWSSDEFISHVQLLKIMGAAVPEGEIQERIKVGGKMLRFLLASNINSVKETLEAKICEVVQARSWNQMEHIISPTFKGSLVSLDLPDYQHVFSRTNPSAEPVDDAPKPTEGGQSSMTSGGEPKNINEGDQKPDAASERGEFNGENGKAGGDNPFSIDKAERVHVSEFVIEQLEVELKRFTCDEIGMMAEAWSTNGYMSVFGALFERHSHLALLKGKRMPLYALLPPGGKSQMIGNLEVPAANQVLLLGGNQPEGLRRCSLDHGTHVRPVNSNFPTYDLYVVSSGTSALCFDDQAIGNESSKPENSVSVKKRAASKEDNESPWKKVKLDGLVGFGLQCTVSGASGVPPRPKHKVCHKIVIDSASEMKTAQPNIKDFATVFVVPPICAKRFVYQMPQTSKNEDVAPSNMPKVQFVAALSTNYSQGFEKMVQNREKAEEEKRQADSITFPVPKYASDDNGLGRATMPKIATKKKSRQTI